jgi:hypothetical protein
MAEIEVSRRHARTLHPEKKKKKKKMEARTMKESRA